MFKKCRICNYSSKKNKEIKLPFMNNYFICEICNTYKPRSKQIQIYKKIFSNTTTKVLFESKNT